MYRRVQVIFVKISATDMLGDLPTQVFIFSLRVYHANRTFSLLFVPERRQTLRVNHRLAHVGKTLRNKARLTNKLCITRLTRLPTTPLWLYYLIILMTYYLFIAQRDEIR